MSVGDAIKLVMTCAASLKAGQIRVGLGLLFSLIGEVLLEAEPSRRRVERENDAERTAKQDNLPHPNPDPHPDQAVSVPNTVTQLKKD